MKSTPKLIKYVKAKLRIASDNTRSRFIELAKSETHLTEAINYYRDNKCSVATAIDQTRPKSRTIPSRNKDGAKKKKTYPSKEELLPKVKGKTLKTKEKPSKKVFKELRKCYDGPASAVKRDIPRELAIAADREGLYPHDLVRFPDLLLKHKLPKDISPVDVHKADQIPLTQEMLERLRNVNIRKTPSTKKPRRKSKR